MSARGPGELTPEASPRSPNGGFLGLLRVVSLFAVAAGAVGSVGLMFRAGQRAPRFLLVLFTMWVLFPFVALLWANVVSKHWSAVTRSTLYCVTLVVTLGSVAIYGELIAVKPRGSPNAFLFVAVPPASCVLMTMVVSMAAWVSGRRSRRGSGA